MSCHLSMPRKARRLNVTRAIRCAPLALVLPASSALAADDVATANAAQTRSAPLTFAEAFAPVTAPQPITTAPGAVDLTTFTAPLEPIPTGPRVIRNLGTKTASYYGGAFTGA